MVRLRSLKKAATQQWRKRPRSAMCSALWSVEMRIWGGGGGERGTPVIGYRLLLCCRFIPWVKHTFGCEERKVTYQATRHKTLLRWIGGTLTRNHPRSK